MIRRARIRVSTEAVKDGLNLPSNITIVHMRQENQTGVWDIFLEGGNLPEVPELEESQVLELKDIQ